MPEKMNPNLSGLLQGGSAIHRETTPSDKPKTPVDLSSVGGVEVRAAREFENTDKEIDFSEIGGKRIGQHITAKEPKGHDNA